MHYWTGLFPDLGRMRANSAWGLVLGGISVWFALGRHHRHLVWATRISAVLWFTLALLSAAENNFGWNFGIDTLFVPDALAQGRMGRTAILCSLLAAPAVLLISSRRRIPIVAAQVLMIAMELTLLPPLLGYLFGVAIQGGLETFTQVALHTVLGFATLGVAILALRPRTGPIGFLLSKGQIGATSRRLLVSAAILIPVLGWLILRAGAAWGWQLEVTVATLALACLVGMTGVILLTGVASRKLDARRHAAELDREKLLEHIQKQNSQLEHTVELRTAALGSPMSRLASAKNA